MNTDKELMQRALEALEWVNTSVWLEDCYHAFDEEVAALRDRLARPEQEPVFDCPRCGHCCPPQGIYYTPPQRKPLTDDEIEMACVPLGAAMLSFTEVARAIEAAHGIGEKPDAA